VPGGLFRISPDCDGWTSQQLYRGLQRQTLNQKLRRRIVDAVSYGMALEGLTAADLADQH
jgi:hypothetical protein